MPPRPNNRDPNQPKPRRPRGTGSLTRIEYPGGPRWRVVWRGQVRQFRKRAEAEEYLQKCMATGHRPVPRMVVAPTFGEAAELVRARWEAKSDRVRTERTLESYSQALEAMLATWKDHPIHATTTPLIDEYVAVLRSKGLSTSSIRHRLDCLAQCMRAAVEAGWLPVEPCRVRRPPLARRSTRDAASEDEVKALVKAAEKISKVHLAVILLAADAGLRRGEMAQLQPEDVDLKRGTITLHVRSEQERTKSGRSRVVPIFTNRLLETLTELIESETWIPRTPADVTWRGTAVWLAIGQGRAASRPKKDRGKRVCHLHRLRHRWVTRLLEAGRPPHQVAEWAGHADLQTTLRYTHPENRIPPGLGVALGDNDALMTQSAEKGSKVVRIDSVTKRKRRS